MADAKIVNTGENTPEYVAYQLMQDVMRAEGKALYSGDKVEKADRKYLLDTYAECIYAVMQPWKRLDT